MEKKVLDAMKKAGKPVRPGEVAEMIGEESKAVSKIISALKKVAPGSCRQNVEVFFVKTNGELDINKIKNMPCRA